MSNNWKGRLTTKVIEKMNFIENCFNSENELELKDGLKLIDYYVFIINEYNFEVNTYKFMKTNPDFNDVETLNSMKESLYYFR